MSLVTHLTSPTLASTHLLAAAGLGVERLEVAGEDVFVVLLLHSRQLDTHDELGLGGHVLKDTAVR